jgi:hypothetical protein
MFHFVATGYKTNHHHGIMLVRHNETVLTRGGSEGRMNVADVASGQLSAETLLGIKQ